MGLFSKLFKGFEPQKFKDPNFGLLTSDASGFWKGSFVFPSTNREIEFSIDGAPDFPTKEQIKFLCQVKEHFIRIETEFSKTLFEDIDPLDDGASPEEIFSQMELLSIHIPKEVESPVEWEIVYGNEKYGDDHLFTVPMKDWKSQGLSIDG